MSGQQAGTVRLVFGSEAREAETHTNLSAVRSDGDCLWVAGDETATLERLTASGSGSAREYAAQRSYALAELVSLPGPAGDEADIEGIGRSGPYLWAVGSHSRKRKKPKSGQGDAKALKRLGKVQDEVNRHVLVRIPVATDDDGLPTLVREVVVDGERCTAAVLGGHDDALTGLLVDDEHLGPFLPIPSKDNGLDVEGVAVQGERVHLGLRGPVLRGWAVVLELRPYVVDDDPGRLRLQPLGRDGEPYRKHVLDLDGLGIRDLCPDGDDLLVLAGPTMDLDGPVRLYRWHGAAGVEAPEVVRGDEISVVMDLPYGDGDDHAEGIALVPGDDAAGSERRLMVVYDSPAAERVDGGAIVADLVDWPT